MIDAINKKPIAMVDKSKSGSRLLESYNLMEDKELMNLKHNDVDSDAVLTTETSSHNDCSTEKSFDEDFVDKYAEMSEKEEKVNDAWLNSLKTSENDDTQVVYDVKPKENEDKSHNLDTLYKLPKVEVIRLLISKLEDDQSPSDYIKSYNSRDKSEDAANEEDSPYEVSDLAHVLTMSWQNVYFMTKDEIVEALMNYKNDDKELKTYEFRWVRDELAVHGPYQHEDILMWIVYGYVSEENPILVRELNEDGNPISLEWLNYKDSDVFNIFAPSKNKKKSAEKKLEELVREEPGCVTRKKQKLMGLRVKDNPELYDESVSEHYV